MGTRGGSRVLAGGTCSAVIVLCGGMLQGDEAAPRAGIKIMGALVDHVSVIMQRQFQQFVGVLRASGSVPRLIGGQSSCMQILVRRVHTVQQTVEISKVHFW